jgi:hypothetical protein
MAIAEPIVSVARNNVIATCEMHSRQVSHVER